MAKLLVLDNGAVQELRIGQELTIGRAYSNVLRLEGDEISRVHCIIYRRGDDYVIRDLDSKNGVYVNGLKVLNSLVAPGDEIQVGNYVLLFDPPQDFSVEDFLKRHGVGEFVHASNGSGPKPQAPVETPEEQTFVSDHSYESFHARQAPIFYSMADVERIAEKIQSEARAEGRALMGAFDRLTDLLASEECDDESQVYYPFIAAAVAGTGADRGVIVLREDASESALRLGALEPQSTDIAVNRVVLKNVLREHKAVLCNDVQNDKRFQKTPTVKNERIGSLLAYPLWRGQSAVGVIYVDVRDGTGAFGEHHLVVLQYLSRLLSFTIRRTALSD